MKFHITKLNLDMETDHSNLMALAAMSYLKTPKAVATDYQPHFEDVVQHNNKLGIVMDTQGVFALVHYLTVQNGKWSATGDTNIVRADELKLVDHEQITDSQDIGIAALYRGFAHVDADYPELPEGRWW